MKILLFIGLFALLASTFGAEPDQNGINPNDYNMIVPPEDIADSYDGQNGQEASDQISPEDDEMDIDIIPLNDVIGLVTPDGELITDPDLQSEMTAAIYDGGMPGRRRRKRWVPIAVGLAVRGATSAYRAYRGWRAARVIQRGTQASPFKPKMRVKQYERPGNFRDAFQTFKSAKPTDVKRFHGPNGVRGATGRVGDRTITVRNKSDSGRPTVEMFKNNVKKSDRITDKIRFND